jgi:hypothetical protein
VTAKEHIDPGTDRSQEERERDGRGEPRSRWRGPLSRTPRPWRGDAETEVAEPARRGKLHQPPED